MSNDTNTVALSFSSPDVASCRDAVVVCGVFDGLHTGHRQLITQACDQAKQHAKRCIILTFDIDPDELMRPARTAKLMSNEARLYALEHSGADALAVMHFSRACAALSARAFLEHVFADSKPYAIHVGANFRFGAHASGDTAFLRSWCEERGIQVCVHALFEGEGGVVSASRIRAALQAGDIQLAETLLGHSYELGARVQHGRAQGRTFGIQTANLHIPPAMMLLPEGVYAARCTVDNSCQAPFYSACSCKKTWYKAAVSLGVSPTFNSDNSDPSSRQAALANCEVHILDFSDDIYDAYVRVHCVRYLRALQRFSSTDALIACITNDIAQVKRLA